MATPKISSMPQRFLVGASDEIKSRIGDIFRFINSDYKFDVILYYDIGDNGLIEARELADSGEHTAAVEMSVQDLRRYRRRANTRRTHWCLLPPPVQAAILRLVNRT